MDSTTRLLAEQIHQEAVAQGLVAYAARPEEDPNVVQLQICERGTARVVLLELQILGADSFKLVRHRTPALTRRFKGRHVDRNWLSAFIKANPRSLSESEAQRVERIKAKKLDHVPAPQGKRSPFAEDLDDWRALRK